MLPAELSAATTRDPVLRAEIDVELRALRGAVNAQVDPHARLDFLAVVREQWTVENGFITPTMKIKRNRSEEHTSELQSLMRISYAVFCLQKKTPQPTTREHNTHNTTSTH